MSVDRGHVFIGVLLVLVCSGISAPVTSAEGSAGGNSRKEQFRDDPRGRANWFLRGRAPRAGGLAAAPGSPAQSLLDSVDQAVGMEGNPATAPSSSPGLAGASTPKWVEIGPKPQLTDWGPVSGRVTALAVDLKNDPSGNTIYVGTAFGGVWKSTNALKPVPHFEALSDRWPSLSVGSLALDSSTNPPTLYVGTGEANNALDSYYGVGVIVATDGGKKWSKPVFRADKGKHSFLGGSVSRILVDSTNPKLLIAAISTASNSLGKVPDVGIYESNDAGQSWKMKLDLTLNGAPKSCSDIAYDPKHHLYFAAVGGLGIYEYQPGRKWTLTASPFHDAPVSDTTFARASLAVRKDVNGALNLWSVISDKDGNLSQPSASDTGLVLSTDEGKSWNPIAAPKTADLFGDRSQGWYDQVIAAPEKTGLLLLGGIDIWSSQAVQNGWTNLTNAYGANPSCHPDQHAIGIIDASTWIIGNDGGIWLTRDAGAHWSDLNNDIGAIQLMSATPDRVNASRFIGASQDNGTAWAGGAVAWSTTLLGDGGYTVANSHQDGQYFTEQFGVSIYRSDDAGHNWQSIIDNQSISTDEEKHSAFYLPYTLLPSGNQLIVGTFRVWRGPTNPTAPTDWQPISGRLGAEGSYIESLAAATDGSSPVYAATSDGHIYQNDAADSATAADHWKEITGPSVPQSRDFGCLTIHPDGTKVFLGILGFGTGHVYLYSTTATGQNWVDISNNLPNSPVNSILVDPLFPNDVYVATDIGVFVATDGGTQHSNWKLYGPNLPRSAVLQLKLTPTSPRQILAATHGRGAWSIPPVHTQ
jgi:photosystem II stability/assembly factor-like uncharacterized protein